MSDERKMNGVTTRMAIESVHVIEQYLENQCREVMQLNSFYLAPFP
jgi:hypothetical protein